MKIDVTKEHCKFMLDLLNQTSFKGNAARKVVEFQEVYERALQVKL